MRWSVAFALFATLIVGASGCRSTRCDRVESELRAREEDVRTLKEDNQRLDCLTQTLTRELAAVRGEPGPNGIIEKPSEPYPVRSLVIGRLTSGRPSEECGGDDGLIVFVEPRDCDNQAIKAPGMLAIDLIEKPNEGIKRPIWRWVLTPDQLRCAWQNGLFTTGYRLSLPFKVWPTTNTLRVVARFKMINGRVFEADRDITIRLPPQHRRPRWTPGPSGPAVVAPAPRMPATAPPRPGEKELPAEKLPPPTPVPDKKPVPQEPPPPDPPPSKNTEEPDGPILTSGKVKQPAVQMFRPVPLEIDP